MITNLLPCTRPFLPCALFVTLLFTACTKSKVDNKAPGAFTVTVSNASVTSAELNWTAAKDPENESVSYKIELNTQSVAQNITTTNYSLQNLTKTTAYSGKVTATDASGNSTASNFNFTTSDDPVPSDFALKLDEKSNKSISVSWTASTLPQNQLITYDVFADAVLKVTGLTQTTYVVPQLTPNTSYKIKVVAKAASGKSFEKILDAQTNANSTPASAAIQKVENGFSFIKIKWTKPADADNDSLSYFINKSGTITPLTVIPVNDQYTYVINGLNVASTYTLKIIAKDPFGAESISNSLVVITENGPYNNFSIAAKSEGNNVVVEWNQSFPHQFVPAASSYFMNNVEKSLTNIPVTYTDLGNGAFNVKVYLSASDFPENISQSIKLKLNWGPNESNTQSSTINFTRYVFTATTAEVGSAIIKVYSNGDHGFILKFKNDIISDFNTWSVEEIKFENTVSPTSISLQFASGKTVSSVFGGLTATDYNYLKTRTQGYIIIKDEGGYHKLNFMYTAF